MYEVLQGYAIKQEGKLLHHDNEEAIQLQDKSETFQGLKPIKRYKLINWILL